MLKTVLVILTTTAGGQTHFAMTDVGSVEECHATADMISSILGDVGIEIAAIRCGQTQLNLTEFEHGVSEEDMHWHYRVVVHGTSLDDGFGVEQVDPGACETSDAATFCAISAQYPIGG